MPYALLQAIGLVVLTSFGCYSIEGAPALHPLVKRGVQIAGVVVCTGYIGRLFGVV